MPDQFLLLDVSSAPIPDAVSYMEPVSAPVNYRDKAKIDAYVAEKTAERMAGVALDIDLAQVTGIAGWRVGEPEPFIYTIVDEPFSLTPKCEAGMLGDLVVDMDWGKTRLITYGGFNFDLPLLMRRARYLGVDFPILNLDRYRSPHIDLCEMLSDREWKRRRPLSFYVRRLGWTDLRKPLSGEEEARVLETGRWAELEASLHHDITALYRLTQWLGIWKPEQARELEPTL
mgnify:CR=1 FL=1